MTEEPGVSDDKGRKDRSSSAVARFGSKLLVIVAIVAALVGIYAAFGYRTVPALVKSKAEEFVRENYGRELQIAEVRFDPFDLRLEIMDLALPDADGELLLGFDRLLVDFELASVWERALVFSEVALDAPVVRAVIRPDGSMNLADLALPPDPEGVADEDQGVPAIWLQLFSISDGRVDFEDRARATPFSQSYLPVTFTLRDFRTTPEGGDFALSARGEHGGQLEWKGEFSLAPNVASTGEISLVEQSVTRVGELLGDALPFELTRGTLALAATYELALGDGVDLDLKLPSIELADLGLRARGVEQEWVNIPLLSVSDTAVQIPENSVAMARVLLQGLEATAWLAEDGSISIERLFAPPEAPGRQAAAGETGGEDPQARRPAGAADQQPAAAASEEAEWTVSVAALELSEASVQFEDRFIAPVTPFSFAPVNVKLTDLSLDLSRPLPIELTATVNDHVPLKIEGTVTPDPLAADLGVSLSDARMQILQPYILPLADVTIRDGRLQADGRLGLLPPGADGPEFAFEGDVSIRGFKSTDNALDEDFINYELLQLSKLRYSMAPDGLDIDRVLLRKPYARVILSKNQVLNIAAALDPEGTAAAVKERETAAARQDKDPPPREAGKRDSSAAAAAAAPQPAESEMPIRVREVRIENGQMNYSDFFIEPNFSADIKQLNGTIKGLSSDPNARAQIALEGKLGEFSPVTINGESQPFAFDRYTDIEMRFEDIPLPVLNPYSGTFAGFNIASGMLTTELAYHIENRALDADHHIVIDQLEWGEATGSKKAVTLPIRFATSLLKDANGVIDLDIPVNGTLDDPEFRIGPIVWQIVRNLIVKVVSAPFKFLGSLFEGAEEAKFVDFAPGDATLPAASAQSLQSLAQALVQKPALKLDVPIGTVAELDAPVLAERRYEAELQAELQKQARKKDKKKKADDAVPGYDTLDAEQKIELLTALATRLNGTPPALPPEPPRPEGMSRREARAAAEAATVEYLEQQLKDGIRASEADLDALGQARSEAVRAALLGGGQLDPGRVIPNRNGKVSAESGQVRFELEIR
jgi:hypothetical protein